MNKNSAAFGVRNGLAPIDEPRVITIDFDMSAQSSYEIDLKMYEESIGFDGVQSLFVNNQCGKTLKLTVYGTGQTIKLGAGRASTAPIYASGDFSARLETSDGLTAAPGADATVKLLLANFPQPYAQWV